MTALIPRGRLEQVLVNLTRNALRAVRGATARRVTLFARAEGEWAIVGVEDDGPGIPPGRDRRACSTASTAARSTRDRQRGSGLGLTVVRRIAEAAGGSVSAQQREPRGVRVVVAAPARLRAARAACRKPSCRWASTVASRQLQPQRPPRARWRRAARRGRARATARRGSAASSRGGRVDRGRADLRAAATRAGELAHAPQQQAVSGGARGSWAPLAKACSTTSAAARPRRRRYGGRARTRRVRCARSAPRGLRRGRCHAQ